MINDKLKQVADLMQECVKAGKMEWKNDHGDWYEWRGNDLPNIVMFENGTIRPHDPLREIKEAFERGEKVEYLADDNTWNPVALGIWSREPERYRIARWYRVTETLCGATIASNEREEKTIQSLPHFVRWLTERVYY